MSVTDFRAYLQCPYRYALSRIGRLEEIEDAAKEMTAGQFGELAHEVLRRFGADEAIRDATEPTQIREFLLDQLGDLAHATFGQAPLPAVAIQLDRLATRLEAFALRQTDMRRDGWRIIHVEHDFKDAVRDVLEMGDGEPPMPLRGKVDRIDRHETHGGYRIIDYKTGDTAKTLNQAHHGTKKKREKWIDLQLPLYDMLASRLLECERCELAYMLLPKKPSETKLDVAPWTAGELDGALELAREIVRDIRAGRLERNPDYSEPWDAFARICQTNVFTAAAMDAAAAGGDGDDDGGPGE
jgi:RecB family exonuclease